MINIEQLNCATVKFPLWRTSKGDAEWFHLLKDDAEDCAKFLGHTFHNKPTHASCMDLAYNYGRITAEVSDGTTMPWDFHALVRTN